jgi:hypothetical protein
MKLSELKTALRSHPEKNLLFILPDGDPIPADFHVTEVGHVAKNFVDCGGTVRATSACVLQTWVARNDKEHRLTSGKLASILDLAARVLPGADLEVEVEYEGCAISQYPVLAVAPGAAEITFTLGSKHTDCLAREACGLEPCGCGPSEGDCCPTP